ncbi:MAG: cyclic nucleotide-binding domain-containing protein [Egibacteraceae bacterium]
MGGRGAFLSALSAEEREDLGQIGRTRDFHHGETLFHEGDPSNHVAIVLTGHVKVSSSSEGGVESLLAIRGEGDSEARLRLYRRHTRA